MQQARFYFHGILNDFLNSKKQNNWLPYAFKEKTCVKDAIEALGVPHPEVGFVFVQQHRSHSLISYNPEMP